MTIKTRIGLVFILGAAFALGGCRDRKSGSSEIPTGGNTPREALQNFANGFNTENIELIKASIYVPDNCREFADTALDSLGTTAKFHHELENAYGKEATKDYTFSMKEQGLPSIEEIEKMTFNEEGDKATAKYKNDTIKFIKKDGRWLVDFSDEMPKDDLKQIISRNKKVIELTEKYRGKIGTEGYTASKIMDELYQAIAKSTSEAADSTDDTVDPGSLDRPDIEPPSTDDLPLPPTVSDDVTVEEDNDAVVIEVEPSTTTDTGSDTSGPKAAMLKMAEAYKALSLNALLASIDIAPKDKPYVETLFKYIITIKTFERKLQAAYSSSELKAAGFIFSDEDSIPTPEDINNMTINVSGNTATATIQGKTPMKLTKKNGRWLVVFDDVLPPVEDRDKIMSQIGTASGILNGLMPKIGAKGVTARDISDEYQAEIRKAMEESKE